MPSNFSIGVLLSIAAIVGTLTYMRLSSWKASVSTTPSVSPSEIPSTWYVGAIVNTPVTCLGSLQLTGVLGNGRNSVVFSANKTNGGDGQYAVKVRSAVGDSDGQLTREFEVLTALNSTEGFPHVFCHVVERNFLVMELLTGYKPLTQFPQFESPPIPITNLVHELITRLESVHNAGYVHVDVHRRNILVNVQTGGVALIDFGLAVAQDEHKNPKYVNLYLSGVHEGAQLPMLPVDDIERLVYVLINQFYAPLPWSDLFKFREKIEADLIEAMKARLAVPVPVSDSLDRFKEVLNRIDGRVLAKKAELVGDLNFFTTNRIPLQLRSLLKYAQTWDRNNSGKINYSYLRALFLGGIEEGTDEEDEIEATVPFTPVNSPAELIDTEDARALVSSTGNTSPDDVNDP